MCKFEGHTIFIKRDIQPRGNSAKVPLLPTSGAGYPRDTANDVTVKPPIGKPRVVGLG